MFKLLFHIIISSFLYVTYFAPLAWAESYELIADEIFYDDASRAFKATGDVRVLYQDKKIWADRVSYDDKTQILRVTGNVIFQDEEITFFAHKMLFDENFNRQEMETVALRFDEKKRMRALYLNVEDAQNETILRNMIYTPCRECFAEDGTEKLPLWQIRSRKTVMNSDTKTLTHQQLYVDIKGKTILYLPKLRHVYDSSVPLSGVLWPTYGTNNRLGFFYAQPFYYSASPAKDLTIVPVYSSNNKHILTGSYRTALSRGMVQTDVTVTDSSNQTDKKLRGDETFYSRVLFKNQLNQNMRIDGKFHYLDNQNFFSQYRQNGSFNNYGGVASSYQDHIRVEQFYGRDYILLESRYKHRLKNKEGSDDINYYTFPVAQLQYYGGKYRFAGGYVQGSLGLEELQRTSYEHKGRRQLATKGTYQKNIWLTNQTLFEFETDYIGRQVEERAETDGNDQKFADRGVAHYYGRLRQNFDYRGDGFTLGLATEFLSHNSFGNVNNENFINEDSNAYTPDVGSLLAFEPLGNGEDIMQAGRRKAAGVSLYYQQYEGVYTGLNYARADIVTFDKLTNETLHVYTGKTDHVLNLTVNNKGFSWNQDMIFARENNDTLISSGVVSVNGDKADINLSHRRYSNIFLLTPAQRYIRLQADNPTPETIEESVSIGVKFRPSNTWNVTFNTRYDIENKEILGVSEFGMERLADCIRFQLKYAYDATLTNELEKTVTFSIQLVN